MNVGDDITAKASFQANGDSLIFRWCGGDATCAFGSPDPGSMTVAVTRISASNWIVSTDTPPAGALSLLLQPSRNTYKPSGLYHLPFALEVSCPTCIAP